MFVILSARFLSARFLLEWAAVNHEKTSSLRFVRRPLNMNPKPAAWPDRDQARAGSPTQPANHRIGLPLTKLVLMRDESRQRLRGFEFLCFAERLDRFLGCHVVSPF